MKKVLELIQQALKALADSKATGPRAESIESHLKACASNAAAEVAAREPKEGGYGLVLLLLVVAIIGLIALAAMPARADSTYQSFGATNYIAATTTITSWPTNSPGTNGLNRNTGGAVFVNNNERASLVFKSQPLNSNTTNSVTLSLVRAYSKSPVLNVDASNGSFTAFADWETLPSLSFAFSVNGTNATTWSTNLDTYIQGGVMAVGLYAIQSGFSVAITNYDVGLAKKIIPIVYP